MKIFILADTPGWIVDRITDRMIQGIPHEFTKRFYTRINNSEFQDLAYSSDLIHYQNWDVGWQRPGLERFKDKVLLSIRSFRYPEEIPDFWAKEIKRVHVIHPDLIFSIPNSIYIPDGIFEDFVSDHQFTVGFAGIQDEYKGFHLIKRACEILGIHFKPALGIPPKDMVAYYHSIDLYVCASEKEGFSAPVMECLVMNKPVLTTDVGIPKLLNVHKCERTVEGIIKGIEKFYTYPQVKKFSWDNVCAQFRVLYENLK